ncbi:MAG: AzlD domain-containing protein [Pseudomonadota bacterium]
MSEGFLWVVFWCAAATYAVRAGGYLVLSRFSTIPPRVEAGLNAVPAAVMTALVAPSFISGTWREALVLCLTALLSLRAPLPVVVFTPVIVLALLRQI